MATGWKVLLSSSNVLTCYTGISNEGRESVISDIYILTGPESCGKTTLATTLSDSLQAPLVPEASRPYLTQKMAANSSFRYSETDLLAIAHQQSDNENQLLNTQPGTLICDTDLLVIILWSEVRFGHCHPDILTMFDTCLTGNNRHYLLCDCDIPWQPDALRENADSRPELFELYKQKLEYYDLPYTVMKGNEQVRLASAINMIHSIQ